MNATSVGVYLLGNTVSIITYLFIQIKQGSHVMTVEGSSGILHTSKNISAGILVKLLLNVQIAWAGQLDIVHFFRNKKCLKWEGIT